MVNSLLLLLRGSTTSFVATRRPPPPPPAAVAWPEVIGLSAAPRASPRGTSPSFHAPTSLELHTLSPVSIKGDTRVSIIHNPRFFLPTCGHQSSSFANIRVNLRRTLRSYIGFTRISPPKCAAADILIINTALHTATESLSLAREHVTVPFRRLSVNPDFLRLCLPSTQLSKQSKPRSNFSAPIPSVKKTAPESSGTKLLPSSGDDSLSEPDVPTD